MDTKLYKGRPIDFETCYPSGDAVDGYITAAWYVNCDDEITDEELDEIQDMYADEIQAGFIEYMITRADFYGDD